MPGEPDKKNWEKERRDRMRKAFSTLEKLLPSYDPSTVLTRINILNKSIEYIQDMQDGIEDLLKPNSKIITEIITNSSVVSTPVVASTMKETEKAVLESSGELPTLETSSLILANGAFHPVLPQSQPIFSAQIFQVANYSDTKVTEYQHIDKKKICGDEATTSKIVTDFDIKNAASSTVHDLINFNSTDISEGISISNSSIQLNELGNISSSDKLSAQDVFLSKQVLIVTDKCVTKTTNFDRVSIPGVPSNYCNGVLIPEICRPTVMKKTIRARRIGNRPMGRLAFRKFKKIVRKRRLKMKGEPAKRKKIETFMNEDKT